MSSSVVWKNLQLFDSVEATREAQKSKEGDKKKLQIHVERRGVKKNLRKTKREEFLQKSTILGDKGLLLPSLKHSGPKLNKESEEDIVEENLKRLQTLSEVSSVDQKSAEKILERTTKKKIKLVEEVKKDTSTVFTEADFANFAKNYVVDD